MDADAIRAELDQAKVVVRSLRNHARNVTAYLTDLEQRLNQHLEAPDPPAQEAQGHEHHREEAEASRR